VQYWTVNGGGLLRALMRQFHSVRSKAAGSKLVVHKLGGNNSGGTPKAGVWSTEPVVG